MLVNVTLVWKKIELRGEQYDPWGPLTNKVLCELMSIDVPILLGVRGPEKGQAYLIELAVSLKDSSTK